MAYFRGVIRSQSLKMETSVSMILPEYPEEARATIILLHGMSGASDSWVRMTSIERYAAKYKCAVVMPEVQRSFYNDMAYGMAYFTYIAEELPAWIAHTLKVPTDAKRLYVGGLSMGGFGATKVAMTYPERFAGCISLSARYYLKNKVKMAEGSPREYGEMKAMLGMELNVPEECDIERLIAKTAAGGVHPKVYMACGTEDYLYGENIAIRDAYRRCGIEINYEEWPGVHSWEFWDEAVKHGLRYMFEEEESHA